MSITVRALSPVDYERWRVLWDANNQGHRNEDVTAATWQRLMADDQVRGLVAEADGEIAGLVHFILHPVTGHIKPVCYMQDGVCRFRASPQRHWPCAGYRAGAYGCRRRLGAVILAG